MAYELLMRLTLRESVEFLNEIANEEYERNYTAALNSGLVAAEIRNQWLKPGKRPFKATDFVKKRKTQRTEELGKASVDEMIDGMRKWAKNINRMQRWKDGRVVAQ